MSAKQTPESANSVARHLLREATSSAQVTLADLVTAARQAGAELHIELTPMKPTQETHWVCACVKRDRQGRMQAIKLHPHKVARCRVCGITRAQSMATRKPNK